jgi:hypothetical protein
VRAQAAHQALGQHAVDGGGDEVALHPHVLHADDGAGGGVGVQGGQHQVAGERRLHGDLRGLAVAHLADHDDVRVLAQDGAQGVGEGQVDLGWTWIWLMPSSWYSTGSSTVMIFCEVASSWPGRRTAWWSCPSRWGR